MRSLLFLLLLLPCFCATAQTKAEKLLLQAAKACKQVQQGSYAATYRQKYFSTEDTTSIAAKVYFRKLSGNKLGAQLYLRPADKPALMYDGNRLYLIDHQQQLAQLLDSADGAVNFIRSNMIGNLALNPLAMHSAIFKRLAKQQEVHKVIGSKAWVNGVRCYTITLYFPDDTANGTRNSALTYYIGTKDYLPRKYEDKLNWQDQQQYRSLELKHLQVNMPLPDNLYKVEHLPAAYDLPSEN